MNSDLLLSLDERTRIASFLYKLAIRVQKLSKQKLDPSEFVSSFDANSSARMSKLTSFFSPLKGGKPAQIQKVLATRTVFPGEGDSLKLDLVVGPFSLLDNKGDLGVVTSKTQFFPGQSPSPLFPLDDIKKVLSAIFSGVTSDVKLITSDIRDFSDRPYRIEHGYAQELGTKAWKIVHNVGPHAGEVAMWEDPRVVGQMQAKDATEDLDPYKPAVFRSSEEASAVLNQLTRGTPTSTRNIPKFREYVVYVKYTFVLSEKSQPDLYSNVNSLLSKADQKSKEESSLSIRQRHDLISKSVSWLVEKDVSPEVLLNTLKVKDPELAKKVREVLPDILTSLESRRSSIRDSAAEDLALLIKSNPETDTDTLLSQISKKDPDKGKLYKQVLPLAMQLLQEAV